MAGTVRGLNDRNRSRHFLAGTSLPLKRPDPIQWCLTTTPERSERQNARGQFTEWPVFETITENPPLGLCQPALLGRLGTRARARSPPSSSARRLAGRHDGRGSPAEQEGKGREEGRSSYDDRCIQFFRPLCRAGAMSGSMA